MCACWWDGGRGLVQCQTADWGRPHSPGAGGTRATPAPAPRSGPAYDLFSRLSNVKTDNHFKEADCDLGEETQEQFYRHRTN